jgi:choline dehydrogenase
MTFIDANGQRSSAATAYLPPSVIARPNLTVVLKTYTTSLIFSSDTANASSDPKCIGVEVASAPSYAPASPSDPPPSAAEKYRLIAKKEIILCAGAINTPQILMCSGIGPDDVLRKAGIPKLAAKNEELGKQVGKNLSDHLSVWVPFRAKESLDYLKHPFKSFHHLVEYLVFGTGPLTTNGGEAAAFIRLDDKRFRALGIKRVGTLWYSRGRHDIRARSPRY